MTQPTYPGRNRLAANARAGAALAEPADGRATLAALDALAARLDVHEQQIGALQADVIEHIDQDDGPPCAACGLPDAAHMLDPDNAEDWQPQHTYQAPQELDADGAPLVPASWPVQPLTPGDAGYDTAAVCNGCGRSWDDTAVTSMTPTPSGRCPFEPFHDDPADEAEFLPYVEARRIEHNPTSADIETGRDLANDAEQYGAESDARDVAHMIAQALAAARADGYRQGVEAAQDADPDGITPNERATIIRALSHAGPPADRIAAKLARR